MIEDRYGTQVHVGFGVPGDFRPLLAVMGWGRGRTDRVGFLNRGGTKTSRRWQKDLTCSTGNLCVPEVNTVPEANSSLPKVPFPLWHDAKLAFPFFFT